MEVLKYAHPRYCSDINYYQVMFNEFIVSIFHSEINSVGCRRFISGLPDIRCLSACSVYLVIKTGFSLFVSKELQFHNFKPGINPFLQIGLLRASHQILDTYLCTVAITIQYIPTDGRQPL